MAAANPLEYYTDENLQGDYQYISLYDLVNNFMLFNVGDGMLINNIKRYHVIQLAKRAMQELNYDVLREVKGVELDMSDTYTMILPTDYIQYVRVSAISSDGRCMPLKMSSERFYGTAYLQDDAYEILFDDNGYPLSGTSVAETNTTAAKAYTKCSSNGCADCNCGYTYIGIDTTKNSNGEFIINKKRGRIYFDSNTSYKTILLEYISDGLECTDETEIKIHKFAEQVVYNYIKWMILDNQIQKQEYIIKRARNEYFTSLKNSKIRLMGLKLNELAFVLKGRNKNIK